MAGKNRFFPVILIMVILLILTFQIGAESLDDLIKNLTHEDSQVRREAAQEIAKLGPEAAEALPALEKVIVDENVMVRWAAANALTAIGKEAVPVLSKALSAEIEDTRLRAAASLKEIGKPAKSAVSELIALLEDDSADVRGQAVKALGKIGSEVEVRDKKEEIVFALQDNLNDEETIVRRHTALALGELGSVAEIAIPDLAVLLGDKFQVSNIIPNVIEDISPGIELLPALLDVFEKEEQLRLSVLKALRLPRFSDKANKILPVIISAIEDKNPEVRMEAIRALRDFKEKEETLPALFQALDDEDSEVRLRAVYAVEDYQELPEKYIEKFSSVLWDQAGNIRRAGLRAMRKFVSIEKINEILIEKIQTDNLEDRIYAIFTLRKLGEKIEEEAINTLKELLAAEDWRVIVTAANTLYELEKEVFKPVYFVLDKRLNDRTRISSLRALSRQEHVVGLLAAAGDESAEMSREAIVLLLEKMSAGELVQSLVTGLEITESEIMLRAVRGCSQMQEKGREALLRLIFVLEDDRDFVVEKAEKAIQKISGKEDITPVLATMLKDETTAVKKTAARLLADKPSFWAKPFHDTMEITRGLPAVIKPGEKYPGLDVYAIREGYISGKIILEEEMKVKKEIPAKKLKAGENISIEFAEVAEETGKHSIQLTMEKDDTVEQESFYFSVIDKEQFPGNYSLFVYPDQEGELVYTPDYLGNQILDYSYAGYHFSEKAIPDVEGPVFNVVDYGATPDDYEDDGLSIQKAVKAAEEAGGGVVFFPPGIYYLHTDLEKIEPIEINSSNVVLRGSGSTEGGTVLYNVNATENTAEEWMIQFRAPETRFGDDLATLIEDVSYNNKKIIVDDTSKLKPGQWVVLYANNPGAVTDHFMGSRQVKEGDHWEYIRKKGVTLREIHQIDNINEEQIFLKSPVRMDLLSGFEVTVREFEPIEEVGVEDIAFMGNWMGLFVHHRSRFDDYHFRGISFDSVVNSWVRRCSFINLNETISMETTANITEKHTIIAGIGGHTATMQHRSTNNLIALSEDKSLGYIHNFAWRAQTAGSVFWRFDMHPVMPIDIHGSFAYSSLLDAIKGGILMGSGGVNFPQHGPNFVVWNFDYLQGATPEQQATRDIKIDFWSQRPWVVDPIVIGLHGKAEEVGIGAESMLWLESTGTPVKPESLYEAQLKSRLGTIPEWIIAAKEKWEDYRYKVLPEYFYPLKDDNQVFHNYPQEISLELLEKEIQSLRQASFVYLLDQPNDFEVSSKTEGVIYTDFMKVKTIMLNVLSYVHSFSVGHGMTLYAELGGPGTVEIDIVEEKGMKSLEIVVEYPHQEPEDYYEQFPQQDNAYGKYLGFNKALEWESVLEMLRALEGTVEKYNTADGSRVIINIPDMK